MKPSSGKGRDNLFTDQRPRPSVVVVTALVAVPVVFLRVLVTGSVRVEVEPLPLEEEVVGLVESPDKLLVGDGDKLTV
jgi:hypothetical protein